MSELINRESFGYNENEFLEFCNKNSNIPKGTFQIKKRGASYYWYYTLSINVTDRVKYLSKAYIGDDSPSSFSIALKKLKSKYNLDTNNNFDSHIPAGDLASKWASHNFNMKLVNP